MVVMSILCIRTEEWRYVCYNPLFAWILWIEEVRQRSFSDVICGFFFWVYLSKSDVGTIVGYAYAKGVCSVKRIRIGYWPLAGMGMISFPPYARAIFMHCNSIQKRVVVCFTYLLQPLSD